MWLAMRKRPRSAHSGRVVGMIAPAFAAYTAAGYEMYRVSIDEFDCRGPGRIMTLEYDGGLAVATAQTTPLFGCSTEAAMFSVWRRCASGTIKDWIDAFASAAKPVEAIRAGSSINDPEFMDGLTESKVATLVDEVSELPAEHILAFGAAMDAKFMMESHGHDCVDMGECRRLREEADRIAGPYIPPRLQPWANWDTSVPVHEDL